MQSYTKFELILVDDGSKDNSSTICDKYAQKIKEYVLFIRLMVDYLMQEMWVLIAQREII